MLALQVQRAEFNALNPHLKKKKTSMLVHAYNTSTGDSKDTQIPETHWPAHLTLVVSMRSVRDPCLKKNKPKPKMSGTWGMTPEIFSGLHSHSHTGVCIPTCAHMHKHTYMRTILHKLCAIVIACDLKREEKTENVSIPLTLKLSNLLGPVS